MVRRILKAKANTARAKFIRNVHRRKSMGGQGG